MTTIKKKKRKKKGKKRHFDYMLASPGIRIGKKRKKRLRNQI